MRHIVPSLALACLSTVNAAHAAPTCTATSGPEVVPLVELYTSEGCDSCPAADRWLSATFPPGRNETVSVLAFHVDYWDRLGWKDRFASPSYTARQHAAMRANGATFVYTPQVLVQGKDAGSGQRSQTLAAAQAARAKAARATISVDAPGFRSASSTAIVRASVDASARSDAAVWLAYTHSGLVTDVKAGENRGARLTHDHVVGALHGPYRVDAAGRVAVEVALAAPAERGRSPALVAFVQDTKTGEVLQTLTLPACL